MKANALNTTANHSQTLANLLKESCPTLSTQTQKALHTMATIGYTATEQGGYQQALCQTIYQQLINWEFKITDNNLHQFAGLIADLIDITIENLRIINYGTLDNPYYRTSFFKAIEQALPKTPEAQCFLGNLLCQFGRGWKTLPQQKHPLAQQWAQPIAHLPAY